MGRGVIIQQYREVVQYFQKRWSTGMPVIDDIVSLWLSYPNWSRCPELLTVVEVLFSGLIHGDYQTDFRDVGITALDEGVMLSSLHFVRSWMTTGFVGQSRQTMTGFTRHCQTTDMHNLRLQDSVRGVPWEQLQKVSVEELYSQCSVVLGSDSGLPEMPAVDEYRSAVCEQIRTLEARMTVLKSPGKRQSDHRAGRRTTEVRSPRTQAAIELSSKDSVA